MRKLTLLALGGLAFTSCDPVEENKEKNEQQVNIEDTITVAPIAEKKDHPIIIHRDERIDPYFWMRLRDEQKNAKKPDKQTQKVLDYLHQENAWRKKQMKHTEELQESLYGEIVGRIKEDDATVPYKENGYYYYERYEKGKDYEFICRKKGNLDAAEEVLFDVNEMAKDFDYYAVGDYEISPDNKIVGYSFDNVSRRQYTIRFKDVETGRILPDVIKNTGGDIVWANDNKTVFYVVKDPQTLREHKIFRHVLGTSQEQDVLVWEEKDELYTCDIDKSKSNKYLYITSYSTMTTEAQFLDADNPEGEFKVVQPRTKDVIYSVNNIDDKFLIVTNHNAANFKLVEVGVENSGIENWKDVIPHREDTRLNAIEIFRDFLVVQERNNGLTQLRVINNDKSEYYLEFDNETYSTGLGVNLEFDTETLRYGYSSLKTPGSTYEFNMVTKEQILLKQNEVLGGFNEADYETERIWATANDGTKIPVSLVYKKGLKKDGTNPVLLYGYGSYGVTIPDGFRSSRYSLIDRGFVYAIAHIRGSEYMGRQWYEDGKKFTKMNTFTDFIKSGEFLISEGYTTPEHLYAMGGSAGGLLMGAVINLKPEIFNGVIAAVPFVDVVSTMLDETIPLTTGEFDEWGNPKIEDYYHYMKSYSPYDNIKAQDYPNLLITTGYWDSQVQYWEPAKWIAKLRDMKTDDNLLMMECNMSTGHGGASGRYAAYKETAMEYAFFLDLEGISK